MPNAQDIRWFKNEFQPRIEAALAGTPFSVDMIVAVACQETGGIWPILRRKGLSTQRILESENFIVLGRVVMFHVAEAMYEDDRIDTVRLDPVGRLAGSFYAELGKIFSLKRPTYRGLLESGAEPMEPSGGG